MRKKIVAGNWKMNLEYNEALTLFSEIANMVHDEAKGTDPVILCSPFIHLHSLKQLAWNSNRVQVGAQNAHQEESGAYTGEVSAKMLRSIGVEYVILGHSERRQYFGEDDALLAKKTDKALEHGLQPIFCIGETKDERESNRYEEVIATQLENGVFHLDKSAFSRIILAYEPVWAIGTGLTASPGQAQDVHAFIRKNIAEKYDAETADNTTILYGGSCNAKNAPELFAQPDIDGGLIGGASLKSRDFTDIVKALES
ncbi:MAG: triose-phosphate isomerase [Mucilaginibacter polytrichastri]|nr:triose-phosphate isomerase [Mucilaginibacter polytrichastri]